MKKKSPLQLLELAFERLKKTTTSTMRDRRKKLFFFALGLIIAFDMDMEIFVSTVNLVWIV